MVKIIMSHRQVSQNELKIRAELHFEKMDQNADYSEFQPFVSALKPLIDTYSTALINARLGGADRTSAKNKAKVELDTLLTKILKLLEIRANDFKDEEAGIAFAKNAGCQVQETKSTSKNRLNYLEKPILTIEKEVGRSGVINLNWNKIAGALTYAFEEQDKDGAWQNGKYSTQATLQIIGLEVGTSKTYRMRAIGTDNLVSEYSEPVTVWIN
jgi:hypothetical protein